MGGKELLAHDGVAAEVAGAHDNALCGVELHEAAVFGLGDDAGDVARFVLHELLRGRGVEHVGAVVLGDFGERQDDGLLRFGAAFQERLCVQQDGAGDEGVGDLAFGVVPFGNLGQRDDGGHVVLLHDGHEPVEGFAALVCPKAQQSRFRVALEQLELSAHFLDGVFFRDSVLQLVLGVDRAVENAAVAGHAMLFKDGNLEAQLRCAGRMGDAADAGADHDHVVVAGFGDVGNRLGLGIPSLRRLGVIAVGGASALPLRRASDDAASCHGSACEKRSGQKASPCEIGLSHVDSPFRFLLRACSPRSKDAQFVPL